MIEKIAHQTTPPATETARSTSCIPAVSQFTPCMLHADYALLNIVISKLRKCVHHEYTIQARPAEFTMGTVTAIHCQETCLCSSHTWCMHHVWHGSSLHEVGSYARGLAWPSAFNANFDCMHVMVQQYSSKHGLPDVIGGSKRVCWQRHSPLQTMTWRPHAIEMYWHVMQSRSSMH